MSIDINYNYLIEKNINEWPANFNIDRRNDPDQISKKLYDDLKNFLFNERVKKDLKINNIENEYHNYTGRGYYTLFVNEKEHLLSSDYMGSSVYWAIEKNIKSEHIINSLKIGRKLGGHILWPRGFNEGYLYDREKRQYIYTTKDKKNNCQNFLTINQSKGGNEGFYDRIDWTLILLQIYMENMDNEKAYLEKANNLIPEGLKYRQHQARIKRMFYAFFNSKHWLAKFGDFNKFCEVFALFDSFVDSKSNVILMANLFPVLPNDYYDYMNKTCNAINKRNEKLYRI